MTLAPFVRRSLIGFPVDGWPQGPAQNWDSTLDQVFNRVTHPVDVREDADHLYVEAELPGFKKEEIEITLENNELTISAQHKTEQKTQGGPQTDGKQWLLSERRLHSFDRSFKLPPSVDGSNVQAALADGILTVTLNKRQETKPRKITGG